MTWVDIIGTSNTPMTARLPRLSITRTRANNGSWILLKGGFSKCAAGVISAFDAAASRFCVSFGFAGTVWAIADGWPQASGARLHKSRDLLRSQIMRKIFLTRRKVYFAYSSRCNYRDSTMVWPRHQFFGKLDPKCVAGVVGMKNVATADKL
ncbi:hypothetical protein [Novosphingobium umbonatum]|uniref:hypothetical protein n=1 Tax=Novosphingobium umbonatum TaxID=1908524 RepID=UPI001FE684A8|nr:hypothetical protein [Novosphingobium umbonatum]